MLDLDVLGVINLLAVIKMNASLQPPACFLVISAACAMFGNIGMLGMCG